MSWPVKTHLPVFLLFCMLGCSPTAPGLVRIPEFQVLQTQVTSKNSLLDFQLTVKATNPNAFPIQLQDLEGRWVMDGQHIQSLKLNPLSIPAQGSADFAVQTAVQLPASFKPEKIHTFRYDAHYRLNSGSTLSAIQDYTLFQSSFQLK